MKTRFIDSFDVILLDMGNTFMFNVDRFSDYEDFGETYRQVGGNTLSDEDVRTAILAIFNRMLSDSRNPSYYDCFPSVLIYLMDTPESKCLPESEIKLLELVFAMHEVGAIPESHAEALKHFHETHRLGVVSNAWSKSDIFLTEFERAGIRELFDVIIFSSDYGCIKPSVKLFSKAVEQVGIDSSKIVFVGDSLMRDVAGAKAIGLSAVWLDMGVSNVGEDTPKPDLVIHDLQDLMEM